MPPKSQRPPDPRILYWFRTDLRLHDSPALNTALSLSPASSTLIPIWTWDPHYASHARVGPNRWRFLLECQTALSASLTALNPNQKLHVLRGAPTTILPLLFARWDITHLVFEADDADPYARARDEEIRMLAGEAGVKVLSVNGRTLFEPAELVRRNGGRPTMSMAQVLKAVGKDTPPRPLPPPTSLPDPGDVEVNGLEVPEPSSSSASPDLNAAHRTLPTPRTDLTNPAGPNGTFSVPTLEEMGIPAASALTPHRGGEAVALELLGRHCANEEYVATFAKPETAPSAFEPPSTTLLSPHLHFGSLSVRQVWWDVEDAILRWRKMGKKKKGVVESVNPVNLHGQMLFREMYFGAAMGVGPLFNQTVGNPVVRFVDWHLHSSSASGAGTGYTIDSPEAEHWFQRWKAGMTGFPWIDALMRQLKSEGWIHHLGRHSVACFLTRGGCWVHWERGAEVFEEWLVDHEAVVNAGNWMWLSCTAFYAQFYRCYSPIAFGKKWDPEGVFVRRYVPELKNFDRKFIYEPWLASEADQKAWGCVVRGDGNEKEEKGLKVYPAPMFDFNERRAVCIGKMKKAYSVGMYGDDKRVVDGRWKEAFGYDEAGEPTTDETNGIAERPKKRVKLDAGDGDEGEKKGKGEKAQGGKQGTLDRHFRKAAAKK